MRKSVIIAALAAAALAGCKSIEVERHGQKVATWTDADGVTRAICDAKGNPVLLDGGWTVDYFQHWNWQRFDDLSATAGAGVSLSINNYSSGADSNLIALVHTSLDGATKLIAAAGEAYVKVAGGGAQADTALSVGQKIYSYFAKRGGDVSKAKVSANAKSKSVTVSDGSTCITCDAAGNCTDSCSDGCADGSCVDTGATPVNICTGEPLTK